MRIRGGVKPLKKKKTKVTRQNGGNPISQNRRNRNKNIDRGSRTLYNLESDRLKRSRVYIKKVIGNKKFVSVCIMVPPNLKIFYFTPSNIKKKYFSCLIMNFWIL